MTKIVTVDSLGMKMNYYHICCISSRLGKLRSEKREERALVVQARKKKNACYFLGVGSKQGRLDLILPKF